MYLRSISIVLVPRLIQAQEPTPIETSLGKASAAAGLCVNNLCLPTINPGSLLPLPEPLKPTPSNRPQFPKPSKESGTTITETVVSVQAGPSNTVTLSLPTIRATTVPNGNPGMTVTNAQPTAITTVTRTETGTTWTTKSSAITESASSTTTRESTTRTGSSTSSTSSRTEVTGTSRTSETSGHTTTSRSSATFVTVNVAAMPTRAGVIGALLGGAVAVINL